MKVQCWSVLPESVNILVWYQVSYEYETILLVGSSLFWSQDTRVKGVSADKPEYSLPADQETNIRSVARKETLGVHQKNWVCHIYCQINAQKKKKQQACLLGINMLV